MIVGQGPAALAVGAGGGYLDIFTLIYPFSPLSPSLWETALYRLKYCLKGLLNPKQPTNQSLLPLLSGALNFCLSIFSQTLDADYPKNQDALLTVLCKLVSGDSFELILSAAAATGKLSRFALKLIK